MHDFIIIGAGIFGSIINKTLREAGARTVLIDAQYAMNGSMPAGCLMKPGWLSGFSKGQQRQVYNHLNSLYGVDTIEFTVIPSGLKTKIWHVNPWHIMDGGALVGEAVQWDRVAKVWFVITKECEGQSGPAVTRIHKAPYVIFATGIWAVNQFPSLRETLKPKMGVSFYIHDRAVSKPFINTWAPYKQIVAFNMGYKSSGIWIADGTALKPESFTKARIKQSKERCCLALKEFAPGIITRDMHQCTGTRPYYTGEGKYLLETVNDGMFVASGGGKNGTAAAALCALELKSMFKL